MQIEAQATVDRPRAEVFDYIAHAESLPEYVIEFASVRQVSSDEPGQGTEYAYTMARCPAGGTFQWTEFEPSSRLAWQVIAPLMAMGIGKGNARALEKLKRRLEGTRRSNGSRRQPPLGI